MRERGTQDKGKANFPDTDWELRKWPGEQNSGPTDAAMTKEDKKLLVEVIKDWLHQE